METPVRRTPARSRGIVLIFVAGILTILAALGTSFYAISQAGTTSAVRYSDMVRADLLAQAGIAEAVAEIRNSTFRKTEDPTDRWYTRDWLHGAAERVSLAYGDGKDNDTDGTIDNEAGETLRPYTRALSMSVGKESDRYTLEIEDGQSKININACDNLAVVLDNLCRLIGPPLVPADQNMIQPRRWYEESNNALTDYMSNTKDTDDNGNVYYELDDHARPLQDANGTAVYGDGYAIAGYRGRNGQFMGINEVRNALTFVDRNANGLLDDPLERLEVEAKFTALKPYITTASWVDTETVCVGKFEWVGYKEVTIDGVKKYRWVAIDRDKSWVETDRYDTTNNKGDLRGCYVSIVNGHGAGQLRRIEANGIDWIAIEPVMKGGNDYGFVVPPGPISSYMIIAKEDALLEDVTDESGNVICRLPKTYPDPAHPGASYPDGTLIDDPAIDYKVRPLCIQRAPVNINTAPDKVLAALFMGINVQHGHPMSLGTDADLTHINWRIADPQDIEDTGILTFNGLKRIPVDSGKIVFDKSKTVADLLPASFPAGFDFSYLDNKGTLGVNEAMELALRVIVARQRTLPSFPLPAALDPDPFTDDGTGNGYDRGPFTDWDDLYFRVIKPWDDARLAASKDAAGDYHKASIARMLMANFNSNTDILKFNPNIEWIDRWGRNFTEMEPVMIYTNDNTAANPEPASPLTPSSEPIFKFESFTPPVYTWLNYKLKDFNKGIDGAYIIRSSRYKSDELIDKTDLNRSSTEFCFTSNGIFLISSIGQVMHPESMQLLSEHKIEAVVKVYDVWRESTQAQFVEGIISEAETQSGQASYDAYNRSGRIARDGYHTGLSGGGPIKRLALNTAPEPLVPLGYQIDNPSGNSEISDPTSKPRDAFGRERANKWNAATTSIQVPDVLANRVLPARYDGQILLAVNTPRYDSTDNGDRDSFLACFIGDLDTDTSRYNGREQAKVPHTPTNDGYKYRVVDTFGMLGLLNDTLIDVDPDLPTIQGQQWVTYCYNTVNKALRGLDVQYYYNNVQCRMGDLRPEGVYLGCPGVSGCEATLKYPIGEPVGASQSNPTPIGGSDTTDADPNDVNFNPNSNLGLNISMWLKSTWHHDDHRRHEFFNCSNEGWGANSRIFVLAKEGRYYFADGWWDGKGMSEIGYRKSDLSFMIEGRNDGWKDRDLTASLHGGYNYVPSSNLLPADTTPESPGFRVQPFRWCMVGGRMDYCHAESGRPDSRLATYLEDYMSVGHWKHGSPDGEDNATNEKVVNRVLRPFISTSTIFEDECNLPAGLAGRHYLYWIATHGGMDFARKDGSGTVLSISPTDVGAPGPMDFDTGCDQGGETAQDARWGWADPVQSLNAPGSGDTAGAPVSYTSTKVFSLNNLNYGGYESDNKLWHYRHIPDEGTYGVIDALKISHKDRVLAGQDDWNKDRILNEMMTSRYYLPSSAAGCPTFTSQTLFESTKGKGVTPGEEEISVVRVNWSVFTPRFMHEEKKPTGRFKRDEHITLNRGSQTDYNIAFKGPFDYLAYNDDALINNNTTDPTGRSWKHISVARPDPREYGGITHASKGVQIQLFAGLPAPWGTATALPTNNPVDPTAFTNPRDHLHNTLGSVATPVRVKVKDLRYQVKFLYPVDPLVDPGVTSINTSTHMLLDTPVFDDISITYFGQTRYLDFRHVNE